MRRIKAILAAGATLAATAGAFTLLPSTAASAALPTCTTSTVVDNMRIPSTSGKSLNCMLEQGNSNSAVATLQGAMNECFGTKVIGTLLKVDGSFGSLTKAALKKVQADIGTTADGIYGENTRHVMRWENDDTGTPCIFDGGV